MTSMRGFLRMTTLVNKVFLGLPHTGLYNYQAVYGLLNLQSPNICGFVMLGNCLVYEARKQIVENAFKANPTHIFFVDSDMMLEAGCIEKLLAHDKDIVSMTAFKRQAPYTPCFFNRVDENGYVPFYDYPENQLIEVKASGLACTLIKIEVFNKLGANCFYPEHGIYGEDLAFCQRAKAAGYKIYVDTNLICGHLETYPITDKHYKAVKAQGANI